MESYSASPPETTGTTGSRAGDRQLVPPLLVDENEAGRILGGVCGKTVDNYRRRGLIPVVRIGTRKLYPVEGLAEFVRSNAQRMTPERPADAARGAE